MPAKILVVPTLLLTFFTQQLLADDYYLFYLGGQSNMDGYGYVSELPDSLAGPVSGVILFHGNPAEDDTASADGRGIWTILRPGHGVGFKSDGKANTYSDRFGVELTFARRLLQLRPDARIAIIKYSRGGTSIDTLARNSGGTWDPDFTGETGINQYDHFLATLRNAHSVRDIDGDGTEDRLIPAGIIWMQGESDGHEAGSAERYLANLKRLMDLVRGAFRTDDLPVVIGKITDSHSDDIDGLVWDQGDLVRQAQENFVRSDVRATIVRSTEKYGYSDKWHYDSAGYIDLGIKFAEAVSSLMDPWVSHRPVEE